MQLETQRSSNPDEIIREWDEWKDLPDLPELDEKEIEEMNYLTEFQNILTEIEKSKNQPTKDQYTKILIFQSRFVLFLYLKKIDIQNLSFFLHKLRILCIMEENTQKFISVLNSIQSFFNEIAKNISNSDKTLKRKKSNTGYKNKHHPEISERNTFSKNDNNNKFITNDNYNKFDTNDNDNKYSINDNDKKFNLDKTYKKAIYNYSNSALESEFQFSRYLNSSKKIQNYNRFQSLATNDNPNEYENYTNKEPHNTIDYNNQDNFIKKLSHELNKLLEVNNGIIDKKNTKKIYEKVKQINELNSYDQRWSDECSYFQNREMVPYQHILSLRNLVSECFK